MECFRIDWKGYFPLNDSLNQPEARDSGIYALYKTISKTKKLWYIGRSQKTGDRLSFHRQGWYRILTDKEKKGFNISFGTIYCLEGSHAHIVSSDQLNNIENFFINILKPKGNGESTKKRYTGNPLLVINTGKLKDIDRIMCQNTQIITLLDKPKHTKAPKKDTPFRIF